MRIGLSFLALALAASPLLASTPAPRDETTPAPFASPLTPEVIDQGATADWVDGRETSRVAFLPPSSAVNWKNQVTWFLVMPGARTGHNGITFGASTHAGPRHLRVGLLRAVTVGSVLTRGDISRVAVLRPDARYPGDVGRDAEWLEATRQSAGELSLWVVPPGTSTRALRFTADKNASTAPSGGLLLGANVLAGRVANLAPAATVFASSHQGLAAHLNDGAYNDSNPWDDDDGVRDEPISPSRPEWVILSWPHRVALRGVGLFFPFAGRVEAQVLTGLDTGHPREADERQWKTVAASPLENHYPDALVPAWIDFGRTVVTRAVRVRLVAPVAVEGHYLQGRSHDGKHVWLGELMALAALGAAPVPVAAPAAPPEAPRHPPIAVPFTMPEAGYATIVIEDGRGRRVRNLVADTWFAAGRQVAWWDGLDESGRVEGPLYGAHGIYTTVGAPVAPGTYGVRGLFHGPLALRYELSVYSPGSPPWLTGPADETGTGGWLADHTSPTAVLFLPSPPGPRPRMLLASPITESGHALVWTDLAGHKLAGKHWVGGAWTGASHLARDAGARAVPGVEAYAGVSWEGKLRLTALHEHGDPTPVGVEALAAVGVPTLGGLAARDGVVVAALPASGQVVFVDAARGAVLGQAPLTDGRGLAFDARGGLLALSGRRLLSFSRVAPPALGEARVLVDGLEDPRAVATDARGDIYVADWGASHQVKVFDAAGRPKRVIGRAGGAVAGLYDPQRMNRPAGLTVTSAGQLWVAEDSWAPKRVSVWTTEGALVTAFYGPPQYGGGGAIDPRDATRFYYAGQGQRTGMEFSIDWKTGASALRSIYWLEAPGHDGDLPPVDTGPQTPIYVGDRQYMTDVFNARPTGGPWIGNVWLMKGPRAVRVASFGITGAWPLLQTQPFRSRWPAGVDPARPKQEHYYAWSDLNADGRAEPDEITIAPGYGASFTFNDRLELCTAAATVYAPEGFTDTGVPRYDARHGHPQAGDYVMREFRSGSGTVMALRDGWTFAAGGPVRGFRGGVERWTYPNEWPSQQAGVTSTAPSHPGELMATTRILSQTVVPVPGKVGGQQEIVGLNGDKGNVFLMTADGLFVATLFHDVREATTSWNMPAATRGMPLDAITLHEEAFWTNLSQTRDGTVYLVAGQNHSSVVRVDGLETLRALPTTAVSVSKAELVEADAFRASTELERQRRAGRELLTIPIQRAALTIDGDLGDWSDAAPWVVVNNPSGPFGALLGRVEARAAVAGSKLCLAFRLRDQALLTNTGEAWRMSFATGGALDLMLGTDPRADPRRDSAVEGDVRLLITRAAGKTRAVLYRPQARAARERPVAFSSPWRTITMAEVTDVSDVVALAQKGGVYEVSVPLTTLGLAPRAGLELRGDVGILRGDGTRTVQRLYWQNKIASSVSDIPTEATLTPSLWGRLRFVAAPAPRPAEVHPLDKGR